MPAIEFTETRKRQSFWATIGVAWLSFFAVIIIGASFVIYVVRHKTEDAMDVVREFVNAEFFATNYVLLWAGGATNEVGNDGPKLASMTSFGDKQLALSVDPFTAIDINPVPPIDRKVVGNETEWGLTMMATILAPNRGATRLQLRVVMVEAGGTFKAILWPRPQTQTSRIVQVKSAYTTPISVDKQSNIRDQIKGFMENYYKANNPGNVESYSTKKFKEKPLPNSPYTTIEVTSILATANSVNPPDAKPGDVVRVRVTAKASSSEKTFSMIDAPLKMVLSENNTWLVDGFEDPVSYGQVDYKG